jgi:hypothetical protein
MREISPEELSKILKEHKRWCYTDWEGGEKANLSEADLINADLRYADLGCADLGCAYLEGADLRGADLSGAYLRGANLSGASLFGANLSGANLTQVKNLSINQLYLVKTLYEAELDLELMEQVKERYPHLLEEPKEEEE